MWPEAEKTHELLNLARDGDDSATGRLLDRHRDSLRRMADMRLDAKIRQRVDASDIVQDALIEVNRRLPKYLESPLMPFHLWVRQIMTDRLIDAHRRHRVSRKRTVDLEQAPVIAANLDHSTIQFGNQINDGELTPAAAAIQNEMQHKFEAVIEQMDPQDREIIVMRHFENLTNQEVAQVLNLTEPAASMRYLRAMRRLRKEFSPEQAEE